MAERERLESLGMSREELEAYLESLLVANAEQAAAESDSTVEAQLESPGFASVRAALSYVIDLIDANNAYLARHLLDLGVIGRGGESGEEA